MPALDRLDVLQDLRLAQRQIGVLEALVKGADLCRSARVDAIGQTRGHRLASKAVDDRLDRVGLIGLDLEFELHADTA